MDFQLRLDIRALAGLLLVLLAGASPARAFHDSGVASCGSCHVMHDSQDGQGQVVTDDLLKAGSASELCLSCHADDYGQSFNLSPLAPGTEYGAGNFIFLLEDDLDDTPGGAPEPITGEAAGHSIVAPALGLQPDSRHAQAPGGSFPSAELECTSCHDPHGNQNYRMLYGRGWVQDRLYFFDYEAPQAEGIPLFGGGESRTAHTAYQGGWANWCGNCHDPGYHDRGRSRFHHPSHHPLEQEHVDQYSSYDGDQNPDGGLPSSSYLPEVPFEDAAVTPDFGFGPSPSSRVSCISCHRVHATSAPAAGRWDFNVDRLGDDGVPSGSYPIPQPWADPAQRQLCVKCHDTGGHDQGRGCLDCHRTGGGHGGPDIGIR